MQLTKSGRSIVEVPEDGGKLLTELRGENHREHLLVQYYLQMSSTPLEIPVGTRIPIVDENAVNTPEENCTWTG